MDAKFVSKHVQTVGPAAVAVLFGVMFWLWPVAMDDLWYLPDNPATGTWGCFAETVANCLQHWRDDTGRLANMVTAPFLALLPRWVFAAVSACAVFAVFVLGLRLLRCRFDSARGAVWVLTVTFVLPWFEFLFTVVYAVNYVWGAAIGLYVTAVFAGVLHRRAHLWLALPAAFVCGWWHEGLSVPLFAALVAWITVRGRSAVGPGRLLMLLALAAGIAVLACMPAMRSMTARRETFLCIKTVWTETVLNTVVFNCMFYVLAAFATVVFAVRRWRVHLLADRRRLALFAACLAFGVVTLPIYIVYYNGARTGFFSQLYCCLGVLLLLPVLWPRGTGRRFGRVCAWGAVTLAVINLGCAIKVQTRLSAEFAGARRLFAMAQKSGRNFVFLDYTPFKIGPDALKPSYMLLNFNASCREMVIIPAALSGFGGLGDAARHRCSDPRLVLWRGQLVTDAQLPAGRTDLIVTGPDGKKHRTRMRTRTFTAKDGTRWQVVLPHVAQMRPGFVIADARFAD